MGLYPDEIGVEGGDQRGNFGIEVVAVGEINPLKSAESGGDSVVRHWPAQDWRDALVVGYGVIDLFPAVGRGSRAATRP